MTVIICLGNAQPRQYAKHPQPPVNASVSYLENFAMNVCGMDISGVPAVGDWMQDREGNPVYEITAAHREAMLRDAIEQPFEIPYEGPKARTVFELPADADGNAFDTPFEVLATVRKTWGIHGATTPGWIAGTDPFLVALIQREMGIAEVRDWLPQGENGDINYNPQGA